MATITMVSPHDEHAVEARIDDDRVLAAPAALRAATGWSLEDQGLCRGDVCLPVRDRDALVASDGWVDLTTFAGLLHRPLAVDVGAGAVFLGEAAVDRAAALRSGVAPDFELPDLEGRIHRLSDQRGRKVFLVAWASW